MAPNLLDQNFTPGAPNRVWTFDIASLWTDEGWLYLAIAIDLLNREVVGWSLKPRMTADIEVFYSRKAAFDAGLAVTKAVLDRLDQRSATGKTGGMNPTSWKTKAGERSVWCSGGDSDFNLHSPTNLSHTEQRGTRKMGAYFPDE